MMQKLTKNLSAYPAPVRIVMFLLGLLLAWLPVAIPLYLWLGTTTSLSVVPLIGLYLMFIGGLRLWGKRIHHQARPLEAHGLVLSAQNGRDLVAGMGLGLVSVGILFWGQGQFGWLTWQAFPTQFWRLLLEGMLVGLGVGLAEELVFRGWLLDELRYDWGLSRALWASSGIYAVLHFIKPWQAIIRELPGFPGLVLLGLVLGWSRQRTQGRLGLAIGLHGGLVWGYYLVDVGDWVSYTGVVPDWVTGINQNPLAGLAGLLFLVGLGAVVRYVPSRLGNRAKF